MIRQSYLIAVLLVLARAAAQGPTLGTKPGGIVDNKGQTVGGGKSLVISGPAPKNGTGNNQQRMAEAIGFLSTFLDQLNALQRDTVQVKMILRTNTLELKDLRESIADLQRLKDKLTAGSANYTFYDDLIKQKLDTVRALQMEQDDLITRINGRWGEMASTLQTRIGQTDEFPEFQQGLKGLQTSFGQKRQLADMEVLLSAGRSDDFRRLAVQADQNEALRMPVLMMRVADYMERGEGRLALYAARLGRETYPTNPAFSMLEQGMNVSYLRMIASKASGDRADVHRAWEAYAGEVSGNYLKRVLSGSPRHALDILTGKEFELEQVQKSAMVQGPAEQNGLELMWRLHEKGIPLQKLKSLSADELHQQMNAQFKPTTPYEYIDVLPLHRSLQAAFGNADVQRILNGSKQQFDVDAGRSYYSAEAFDTGMLEWAADAVSVKNVLLFCGPTAVVQYGQEAGMLARLSRLGVSKNAISTAFEGTQTVRDALLSMPKLQQVGQYIGSTRTGASLLRTMETLRYLRYDANPLVKVATGVTEGLGQMLLFEAGGKVGHALGGELGDFLGQALVTLAGNPLADMQQWHVKEGQALEAVAAKMAQTRAKWEATNTLLKDIRLPLRGSVQRLATTEARSAQAIAELEAFATRADQAAAQARAAAKDQTSPVLQAAADEAEALKNATQAIKRGDVEAAQAALDSATKLEGEATTAIAELEKARTQTAVVAADAVKPRPKTTIIPNPEGGTPGAVHVNQTSVVDKSELTGRFKLSDPPGPRPPAPTLEPPPSNAITRSAQELGDEAMAARKFEDARAHYKAGFEKAVEDLRRPNLPPDEQAKLAAELTQMRDRVREARQATRFEESVKSNPRLQEAAARADQARRPFTPEEIKALEKVKKVDTDAVGAGTTGGARRIYSDLGELLGYWKPAATTRHLGTLPETGQMFGELLMSKLGRKLGLNVAEAVPLTLEGEAGVFIRNIPGTKPLLDLTEGARLALKEQIAKFRALQVLIGNYDIHMGNYLVDDAGRVWQIDGGMAQLTSPGFSPFRELDGGVTVLERHAPMPHIKPSGEEAMDWARVWRDWYSHRFEHPELAFTSKTVARIDSLIKGADMRPVAQQIEQFSEGELAALVREVAGTHPEAKDILETLLQRRNALKTLLNEKWPGAIGPVR